LTLIAVEIITEKSPAMLVLVAVNAKILPIGAVRRIVPGIAILVVHGQQLPIFMSEFSAAPGADHPVDLERLLPVITGCGFHVV
jgi:hypothetical protein